VQTKTQSAENEIETTLQLRGSMALRLGPNLRAIVSLRKLRTRSESAFFIHNLMSCQIGLQKGTKTELCSKITIEIREFQQPI
jgi:hypothetical protein